jgi:hypothetical protein
MNHQDMYCDHKVNSYPCFLKEEEYPKGFNESIASCSDRICIECKNDHSFRGNFEDARTIIDLLPELFPGIFKDNKSINNSINKLKEFVN